MNRETLCHSLLATAGNFSEHVSCCVIRMKYCEQSHDVESTYVVFKFNRTVGGSVFCMWSMYQILADSPALPGYIVDYRRELSRSRLRSFVAVDIFVVTEPLPSYEQFLIVGFRGYESCTRCLATARLEHIYFLKYFGPLGRMPHLSLLILFLILTQSDKREK
jgi:hypothetical protein